jgi:hypothetical protein
MFLFDSYVLIIISIHFPALDSRSSSVGDMSLTSDMMDFECDPSDANRLSDFSFDFNYDPGYEPPKV